MVRHLCRAFLHHVVFKAWHNSSNYQDDISNGARKIKISNRLSGWAGWNVGVDVF